MREHLQVLNQFSQCIDSIAIPERFTFPFYYQPHPLCVLAVEQLQKRLLQHHQWDHNFGLTDDPKHVIGKMFGVLVVQNGAGKIAYLAAFSGKLGEKNHIEGFVPPVFDLLAKDGFFLEQQRAINQLNEEIQTLECQPELAISKRQLDTIKAASELDIAEHRASMISQRKQRKQQRGIAHATLSEAQRCIVEQALNQQSIDDKIALKTLTLQWNTKLMQAQHQFDECHATLKVRKQQRKNASANLQQEIFEQYQFLNVDGERKSLHDIFSATALRSPPAGAGECAAPKLLHYAFGHQLKPLAMAEFWWGASPKSEIRQHQQYYPACLGKCQPILAHMLKGIDLDDNPMLLNKGAEKHIDIVYQDECMLIINKPAELLSVPGKDIHDSVYTRIRTRFAEATGAIIVHRLDMATSGLMVIALTQDAHKSLQRQFIQRSVKKTYVAVVEGLLQHDQGTIDLPLRGDLYDRPRQLVCKTHGKAAISHWQVISRAENKQQTTIRLTPHTGRTHQLRVHCAHQLGLNSPIAGDDLYGKASNRLHLHAQELTLQHPLSHKTMSFRVDPDF